MHHGVQPVTVLNVNSINIFNPRIFCLLILIFKLILISAVWKEFSEKSSDLKIKVGAADVNANPVLSGLFSVTSLPTVYQ